MCHVQFTGDLGKGLFGVGELADRGARYDFDAADAGQFGEQVVVNALDEEDVFRQHAAVFKGQHCNGLAGDEFIGIGRGRCSLLSPVTRHHRLRVVGRCPGVLPGALPEFVKQQVRHGQRQEDKDGAV